MGYVGFGRCEPCDKILFGTRKDARHAAKVCRDGDRPRAFRCPEQPDYWHVGHLPSVVRRGRMDRASLTEAIAQHRGRRAS